MDESMLTGESVPVMKVSNSFNFLPACLPVMTPVCCLCVCVCAVLTSVCWCVCVLS